MAGIQHECEEAWTGPTKVVEQSVPHITQDDKNSAATPHNEPEQQILPHNNIPLVFFSLMVTTFLVRLLLVLVYLSCIKASIIVPCLLPRVHWT